MLAVNGRNKRVEKSGVATGASLCQRRESSVCVCVCVCDVCVTRRGNRLLHASSEEDAFCARRRNNNPFNQLARRGNEAIDTTRRLDAPRSPAENYRGTDINYLGQRCAQCSGPSLGSRIGLT